MICTEFLNKNNPKFEGKIFHQSWGLRILQYLENGTSDRVADDIVGTVFEKYLKHFNSKSCANARGTRYRRISGLRKMSIARERGHLESRERHLRIALNLLYVAITSILGANAL